MKILNEIQKATANTKRYIYNYSYSNQELTYKSLLTGFNNNLFSLFNSYYHELNISQSIQDLFKGKIVNQSENQAAHHHVYRSLYSKSLNNFANKELIESCRFNIEKCISLKDKLIKKGIKNIVTLGIGGSFEGPRLLIETLTDENNRCFNHIFLTGPDIFEFTENIESLKQDETFFIVCSKSFSTDEILQSLALSKKWLESKCDFNDHFIAVTSQVEKAKEKGFKDNIIEFPYEIGGRYSIWSPVSLPAILELGSNFKDFLLGGFNADCHLLNDKKYNEFINLLSFADIWYNNFVNKHTRVLLIYSWKLRHFSDYLQQLEMESLGKKPNPKSIFTKTGQVLFGGFGSTAQHSYFQLLHQGTASACADVISIEDKKNLNKLLHAQSQAQSSLLANEPNINLKSNEQVNGNIPTNLFILKNLDPKSLGYLISSWEHRTFINAKMLQINPFDQYGVSAGKIFTKKYLNDHGG